MFKTQHLIEQKFPGLVEIRAANPKDVVYKPYMSSSWSSNKWYYEVGTFRFWVEHVIPQRPAIRPFGTSLNPDNARDLRLMNEILSSFLKLPDIMISAGLETLSILHPLSNNETMQALADLIRSGFLFSLQTLEVSLARGLSAVPGCTSLGEALNHAFLPHLKSLYISFKTDHMAGQEEPTIEVWHALLGGISQGPPAGLQNLEHLKFDCADFFCKSLTFLDDPTIFGNISSMTVSDHVDAADLDLMSALLRDRFFTSLEALRFDNGKHLLPVRLAFTKICDVSPIYHIC